MQVPELDNVRGSAGEVALWGSIWCSSKVGTARCCGEAQLHGENGLRGQARPGVYFYKRAGGDSYVTVTLRDLNARRVPVR